MAKLIEITGKTISGEWGFDDTEGIGIPVLRTTNFTNEGFIDYQNVVTRIIKKQNISEKFLRSGDIIIEKSGGSDKQPVGRVVYYDGPDNTYLFNNFTGVLRVKDPSKWYPKYIFYALFTNYWRGGTRRFENKTTGLHNLKTDDYVARFGIAEIPLDQQICICNTLDKIHLLIGSRKKQLTKMDDLIKERFVEMFGDPIRNSKNFPTNPMTNVCEIIDGDRGKNYPTQEDFLDEGYCLFLNAKNVTSKGFSFKNCTFITKEKDEMLKKGHLNRGDVILTTRGTIGNLAFYDEFVPYENIRINSGMVILRMNHGILLERFFIEQFKMQLGSIKEKIASGSAQPQLPISTMNKIVVLTPPTEQQKLFVDFVQNVDKLKVSVSWI